MVWLGGEAYLDGAPKTVHTEGAHIHGNLSHSLPITHHSDSLYVRPGHHKLEVPKYGFSSKHLGSFLDTDVLRPQKILLTKFDEEAWNLPFFTFFKDPWVIPVKEFKA